MARLLRSALQLAVRDASTASECIAPPRLSLGPSAALCTAGALLRMRRPKRFSDLPATGETLTVKETESIDLAVRSMIANGVGSVLVLSSDATRVRALAAYQPGALDLLCVRRRIAHFLGGQLAGILTESSVARKVLLEGHDVRRPVATAMTTHVLGASSACSLPDIAYLLSRHNLRHLPIVDVKDWNTSRAAILPASIHPSSLRGVLSAKDVAWILFCLIKNENAVSESKDGHPLRVSDMMRPGIRFEMSEEASALEAATLLYSTKRHAVCAVNDKGQMTGILTGRDMMNKLVLSSEAYRAKATVRDIATPSPRAVTPSSTLEEVLMQLTTYGFRHLPVFPDPEPVANPPSEAEVAASWAAAMYAPKPVGLVAVEDVLAAVVRYGGGSFPQNPETVSME